MRIVGARLAHDPDKNYTETKVFQRASNRARGLRHSTTNRIHEVAALPSALGTRAMRNCLCMSCPALVVGLYEPTAVSLSVGWKQHLRSSLLVPVSCLV